MKTRSNRLFVTLPTALLLLTIAWVPPALVQESQPFGGFTVMEIGNDEIHWAVGLPGGFRDGKATLLLTLIAGSRSYASITKGYDQFRPACWTWISQEEGTSDQIVLGDGDDWRVDLSTSGLPEWILSRISHRVCAEFRLQRLGPNQAQTRWLILLRIHSGRPGALQTSISCPLLSQSNSTSI